jgi:hypothetical protein
MSPRACRAFDARLASGGAQFVCSRRSLGGLTDARAHLLVGLPSCGASVSRACVAVYTGVRAGLLGVAVVPRGATRLLAGGARWVNVCEGNSGLPADGALGAARVVLGEISTAARGRREVRM